MADDGWCGLFSALLCTRCVPRRRRIGRRGPRRQPAGRACVPAAGLPGGRASHAVIGCSPPPAVCRLPWSPEGRFASLRDGLRPPFPRPAPAGRWRAMGSCQEYGMPFPRPKATPVRRPRSGRPHAPATGGRPSPVCGGTSVRTSCPPWKGCPKAAFLTRPGDPHTAATSTATSTSLRRGDQRPAVPVERAVHGSGRRAWCGRARRPGCPLPVSSTFPERRGGRRRPAGRTRRAGGRARGGRAAAPPSARRRRLRRRGRRRPPRRSPRAAGPW